MKRFSPSLLRYPRTGSAILVATFLSFALSVALGAPAGASVGYDADWDDDGYSDGRSYSYASVLEGSATLIAADGERDALEINQALLVGDRIWLPRGSRVELALSDRTLLRLEGEAEIVLSALANSADTTDPSTVIRLLSGEAQVVVPADALGEALPRFETPAASLYIHREGTFRFTADRRGFTEVIARDGLVEVVGDRGSQLVHGGEAAWADSSRGRVELASAGSRDSLEAWGDRLSANYYASYQQTPYVDQSLRYAVAPLTNYGSWVEIGGSWGWRPRVEVSWRPYYRGHWRNASAGPIWVSADPWGYVTHHYGSWDYVDHYGWVWYPGVHYSPARVVWYWGPSYVGWCPTGYYEHYYRRHHSGFHISFGVFGIGGGHWDDYGYWSFSARFDFGHHHGHHAFYGHRDLERRHARLEPGYFTGSRGFDYRGTDTYARLQQTMHGERGRRDLPDVSDFVGRKPLRTDLVKAVMRPETPRRVATNAPTLSTKPGRGVRTDDSRGRGAAPDRTLATRPGDDRRGYTRPTVIDAEQNRRPSTQPVLRGDRGDRGDRGTVSRPSTQPVLRGDRGDRGTTGRPSSQPVLRGDRGDRGTTGRPSTQPVLRGDRGDRGDRGTTGRPSTQPVLRGDRGDRGDRGTVSRPSTQPVLRGDRGDRGTVSRPSTQPVLRGDRGSRYPTSRPEVRGDRGASQPRPSTPAYRPATPRPSTPRATTPTVRPSTPRPSTPRATTPSSPRRPTAPQATTRTPNTRPRATSPRAGSQQRSSRAERGSSSSRSRGSQGKDQRSRSRRGGGGGN